MNNATFVSDTAQKIRDILLKQQGAYQLPMPQIPHPPGAVEWSNLLLASPRFRRAHIEELVVPNRMSVLHVCIFPHLDDPAPIYGFDVVAGPARITGMFLDLSPVAEGSQSLSLDDILNGADRASLGEVRTLPEWGSVFSPSMVAIRPTLEREARATAHLAERALGCWLTEPDHRASVRSDCVTAGQRRYVEAQRRNPHTFRMLAGMIGDASAKAFIDEVLFPAA